MGRLNAFAHTSQLKGLPSLCIRMCDFKCCSRPKLLPQTSQVIDVASTDTLSYSVSDVDDSSVSPIQVINATSSSPSTVNNLSMTNFTENSITLNTTLTAETELITITDFTATTLLTTIRESNVLNNASVTVSPSNDIVSNILSSTDMVSLFPSTDLDTGTDLYGSESIYDTHSNVLSASENANSSGNVSTVMVESSGDIMPSVSFTAVSNNMTLTVIATISDTSASDKNTVIPTIETSSISQTIVEPSYTIFPTVTSITQTLNENSSQLHTTEYRSTQTDFPKPLTTLTSFEMNSTLSFPLTTFTMQTTSTLQGESFETRFSSATHSFTITDTVTHSVISSTNISSSLSTSIAPSISTNISTSLPTSVSASLSASISASLPTSISASLPTSISASLSASITASSTSFISSTDISSSKTSVIPTASSSVINTSTESTTQIIQNEDQQSQPLPAIIGGVIGFVLTVVLIGSVTLYLWRRQLSCFSGKPMRKSNNGEDNVAFVEEELADVRRSRPVKLSDMGSHFEQLSADSNLLFSQDFQDLNILSPEFPTTDAELQETRLKNRYTNILPYFCVYTTQLFSSSEFMNIAISYITIHTAKKTSNENYYMCFYDICLSILVDKTRVKLLPFEDEPGSDYINANYALGFTSAREYIAAQGPLASTINDFWRMIWEQNASIIVMLTQCVERGRKKCEHYWPMLNESLYYGDIVVQLDSESHLPDFILRTFSLRVGDLERKVRHYYYLLWPDMGTPACTDYMIRFVSTIRCDVRPDMTGPIVVHCSAGVGRTGTFITLDTLIRKIQNGDDSIDIFGQILQLRHCRLNMVQTESQYIYIHECIRDFMRPVAESVNGHDTEQLYENTSMF
ncbi:receptor-type tyrosine-protein phosphatase alpha-like [Mytilus trossulus]|uniref:receptor-type tyrosine-protein phosphatase alpha-like n=1 Tax=Mytilus trossulus TaxID=6551 RepID=UPI003006BA85